MARRLTSFTALAVVALLLVAQLPTRGLCEAADAQVIPVQRRLQHQHRRLLALGQEKSASAATSTTATGAPSHKFPFYNPFGAKVTVKLGASYITLTGGCRTVTGESPVTAQQPATMGRYLTRGRSTPCRPRQDPAN